MELLLNDSDEFFFNFVHKFLFFSKQIQKRGSFNNIWIKASYHYLIKCFLK